MIPRIPEYTVSQLQDININPHHYKIHKFHIREKTLLINTTHPLKSRYGVCSYRVVNPIQNTSANRIRDANDQGRNTGVGGEVECDGSENVYMCQKGGKVILR